MIGWLIYRKVDAMANKSYIEWFITEAEKQNIQLQLIYREELQIGMNKKQFPLLIHNKFTEAPDFAVIRTIDPILQAHFENAFIPVFNSYYVANICNDKALTYLEVNKLDVPIPVTYLYSQETMPTKPPLSFPFIIKDRKGRGGSHVYMIHNQDEWIEKAKKIPSDGFIAQVSDGIQLGKDVRVFVIGKEIIAAVLRKNDKDFRANFKLGGEAIPFTLTSQMKDMIQKIINHFNFGLVGIDFLMKEDGSLLFNEIEDVVGSRILSETSRINLLEKYITFIRNHV